MSTDPFTAAGSWLGEMLGDVGATEEERAAICFAHGQRSTAADPLGVAVDYLNQFCATGRIPEQPGAALADKIEREKDKP